MIQVIKRAFDIIEYISSDVTKAHTLSEIANHLNLNQGTCANILKTLVERNYVEQIGFKKGYKLGYMIYQIGSVGSFEEQLVKSSQTPINKLRALLNETCLLAVLKKQNRVIIFQSNAERDLMVKSSTEKNAYNSASGRFLLANLPDDELKNHLSYHGLPKEDEWPEAITQEQFWEEIMKVRKDGFSRQVTSSHIIGFAYGVKTNSKVVAAVSVYLPVSRLKEHGDKKISTAIVDAVLEIEKSI